MKLAVKVDVDTYRGTLEGVPELCDIFEKYSVPAAFLFSMGPDNTGKALRRIFRRGFLKKCLRSNVAGNYGIKTLLYGTVLPAPKIGKLCAAQMRSTLAAGFECGIHCWDHFKWQDYLSAMRSTEIEREFTKACVEFEKVFGIPPKCCGAPGWQITPDALAVEDEAGLLYASDVRGEEPFFPTMGGRIFKTLQMPTTLLTLDEVLGVTPLEDVAQLHLGEMKKREYSVLTVHAELEGMAYLKWFDSFLGRLKAEGVEFYSLAERAKKLLEDPKSVRASEIRMLPFTGRSCELAVQV